VDGHEGEGPAISKAVTDRQVNPGLETMFLLRQIPNVKKRQNQTARSLAASIRMISFKHRMTISTPSWTLTLSASSTEPKNLPKNLSGCHLKIAARSRALRDLSPSPAPPTADKPGAVLRIAFGENKNALMASTVIFEGDDGARIIGHGMVANRRESGLDGLVRIWCQRSSYDSHGSIELF